MTVQRIRQWDDEANVHLRVVEYLKYQFKGVVFKTDFGAGIKLSPYLAARQKRLQYRRGFPDIFIFEPRVVNTPLGPVQYYGMGLELKAPDAVIRRNSGNWASDHIKDQVQMLTELTDKGYFCCIAAGFDEAVKVIRHYLNGEGNIQIIDFLVYDSDSDVYLSQEEF